MSKLATDIPQSKKLLELGLSVEKADMHYYIYSNEVGSSKVYVGYDKHEAEITKYKQIADYIPAWSLSQLLDLMPQCIYTKTGKHEFGIDKNDISSSYQIFYENKHSYIQHISDDALDAAFDTVCWLLKNGHIKTEKI